MPSPPFEWILLLISTSVVAGFSVFSVATNLVGLPSPLYKGHTIVAHLYDFAFIGMRVEIHD